VRFCRCSAKFPRFCQTSAKLLPRAAWAALAVWLAAVPVPAPAAVRSPAGRFRIAGETTPEAVSLALALDELSASVAAATGLPWPADAGPIIHVFPAATPEEAGRVPSSLARFEDGALYQRLLLGDLRATGEADLAEGAAALLLARFSAATLPRAARIHAIPAVPAWLSAGLSRILTPAARGEVRRFLKADLARNAPPALADIVSRTALPPGAWAEKTYAAEAVRFLFPRGDAATWRTLLAAIARGERIDPAWLRGHCPALARGQVEATWKAYLAHLADERAPADFSAAEDLRIDDELDELLQASPRDTLGDPAAPEAAAPAAVIAARREAWAAPFARAKALKIRMLATRAADAELARCLAAYAKFFDTLSRPPEPKKSFWKSGKAEERAADAAWKTGLEVTWKRAEEMHAAYRTATANRSRYIDLFDMPDADVLPRAPAGGPRPPLSAYVDRFDR
jgi:hypothetical protein